MNQFIRPRLGTDMHGLNWRMRRVLQLAEKTWRAYGMTELVINSAADREHGAWSWHYFGMAVDLSIDGMTPGEAEAAADDLRRALGPPYQVAKETAHIHVECDLDAFPKYAGQHPGR